MSNHLKAYSFIYGTAWKEERTTELVVHALRAGFRCFDTAAQPRHYREDLVGEGIRRGLLEIQGGDGDKGEEKNKEEGEGGGLRREDLYVSFVFLGLRFWYCSFPYVETGSLFKMKYVKPLNADQTSPSSPRSKPNSPRQGVKITPTCPTTPPPHSPSKSAPPSNPPSVTSLPPLPPPPHHHHTSTA